MSRFLRRRRARDVDAREGRRGPARGAARGVYGIAAALAGIVDVIVGIVCVIIVVGILLVVLGANMENSIVGAISDAAQFLVGPFDDIFKRDDRKEEVAINWGLAVAVYFIVGRLIASLLRRGAG